MENILRGPGLAVLLIGFAFVIGYTEQDLRAWWHSKPEEAPVKAETPPPAPAKQSAEAPKPPLLPYKGVERKGKIKPMIPPPQASLAPPRTNQPSLNKTLDSVKRGSIKDQQVIRRNAYFEKLSQQLRDLKGENKEAKEIEAEEKVVEEAVDEEPIEENPIEPPVLEEEFPEDFNEEDEDLE